MKVLVAKSGPLEGNAYRIAGRTLIGRDGDCDIQVADSRASRKHAAVLEQDDGTVLLRDLASANGTRLGDEQVREALLSPGDRLTVADSTFELADVVEDETERDTQELEIRLVSGPATARTFTGNLDDETRAELIAVMEERKAEVAARKAARAPTTERPCCDSPLAQRAESEGWPHCPGCGAAIG